MPKHENEYLVGKWCAKSAHKASRAWITLFGHTHLQEGWISERQESTLLQPKFEITDGLERFEVALNQKLHYIINPGSVGHPRVDDWRAAFPIYDEDEALLAGYRVPYKLLLAQRRIGVPAS